MKRIPILWVLSVGTKARSASRGRAQTRAQVSAAVTAALLFSAAACSSSPSTGSGSAPNAAGSPSSPSAIGYSHCMRSHGVPNFPDPGSDGAVPKADPQQLGVSDSGYQAAQTDCQDLLPAGSDDVFPAGELQQLLPGMLRFSQCVRSHGEPNWPDPTVDAEGRPGFDLVGLSGVDPSSQAVTECQHLLPSALGGLPISR